MATNTITNATVCMPSTVVVSTASIVPAVVIPECVTVSLARSSGGETVIKTSSSEKRSTRSSMKISVSPSSAVVVSSQPSRRASVADVNKIVQDNVTNLQVMFDEQKHLSQKVQQLESIHNNRLNRLEGEIQRLESLVFVQKRVSEHLRDEVDRLQQFTRRPCVVIRGIDKDRNESPDELRTKVEKVIDSVESSTKMGDVDKFHRNGRFRDGKQEVIVRFNSHSAKEVFFKGRKSQNDVQIYPSLTKKNLTLLHEARDLLEEYNYKTSNVMNPPEAIFADVHGDIQIKFQKKTANGKYIKIRSLDQLALVLETSESCEEKLNYDGEPFNTWGYEDDAGFVPRR